MNEDNSEALNNLIQSIQEKMNGNSNSNVSGNDNDTNTENGKFVGQSNDNSSNFDFSNFSNFFNSNNTNNNNNNNNSDNINQNSNYSSDSTNSTSDNSTSFDFDPTILLKAQKILSSFNSKTPKKELLLSLKPFLRKSRQDKMNEYVTILNVLTVLDNLKNNKGSD